METNLIAEIAKIVPTENYDLSLIGDIAKRFNEYGNVNLADIRNAANADILRLELELETARIRSQVANAVLNSRSVIVLD